MNRTSCHQALYHNWMEQVRHRIEEKSASDMLSSQKLRSMLPGEDLHPSWQCATSADVNMRAPLDWGSTGHRLNSIMDCQPNPPRPLPHTSSKQKRLDNQQNFCSCQKKVLDINHIVGEVRTSRGLGGAAKA